MEQSKFYQIKNITEQEYTLVGCDGSVITRPIQDVDNSASAFTIQDAKDGDVLAVEPIEGYSSSFVAIYKKQNEEDFDSYCFVGFDGKFYEGECGHSTENIHPATKEQRDTLMKAMADAGYTFDSEKKELKKNERKHAAWSEEDECILDAIIDHITPDKPFINNGFTDEEMVDWLKSLKDRVGCESNFTTTKEWSEEDNIILSRIIADYERSNEEWFNAQNSLPHGRKITWLKSLSPQNKWKPSDEQMKLLKELVEDNNQRYFYTLLKSLYDQLKILKGE